jgi:uncharacterized protein YciW
MTHVPLPPARGRSVPAYGFLLALIALAGLALLTLRSRPQIVTGLPEGPLAERMRETLANRLPVDAGGMRLAGELFGTGDEADEPPSAEAQAIVVAALAERPREPRLHAALGWVELSAGRPAIAERCYREALRLAPGYGEARLGLGVTLAMRAAAEADEARARGLRLRAISQFAAGPAGDPCLDAALYNRALLLMRVGRRREARRWAHAYLARDPQSPWSLALTREVLEPVAKP